VGLVPRPVGSGQLLQQEDLEVGQELQGLAAPLRPQVLAPPREEGLEPQVEEGLEPLAGLGLLGLELGHHQDSEPRADLELQQDLVPLPLGVGLGPQEASVLLPGQHRVAL
jgi:hypothetical protein